MPSDPHPREIVFVFERDKLRRYLRLRGIVLWLLGLGGFGTFFGFIGAMDMLQHAASVGEKLSKAALVFAGSSAAAFGLGLFCYLIFSHRQAATQAASISLEVEGAFLRVRDGGMLKTDRKIHFRSLVDYSILEGPLLRRFGLRTLRITVPAGVPTGLIQITGLRDCEAVRDQLAEIDAARELDKG